MLKNPELVLDTSFPPSLEHVARGYNAAGVLQTYETFDVTGDSPEMQEASRFRDEQKSMFMSGEVRNPILNNCPNFNLERHKRRVLYQGTRALMYVQELRRTDGGIETDESQLVDAMIANRINELGFIEAAASIADGQLAEDERIAMGSVLKKSARDIYGMPDRDRALTVIGDRLESATAIAADEVHPAREIAQQLLNRFSVGGYNKITAKMDAKSLEAYQSYMHNICKPAINYAFQELGEKDTYTPDEMVAIFDRYLDFQGYAAEGWRTEKVSNRTMCATKLEDLVVEIGDKRAAASRSYVPVVTSLIHEVEIHVGRQVKGKKIGQGIAEFGFAGYVAFEEPFAATTADVYSGQPKSAGEPFTIGLALAAGYDRHEERDFRDCFEDIWRLQIVKSYKADKPFEAQMNAARNAAYANLTRIWRGMPTDIPGCVFPKDRVYDNTDVIRYLNNGGAPLLEPDFMRLLQAKYDAFDPVQDAYIRSQTN
ncbi:MAG TPA: hypothetical protein VF572_00810 [Candidatus Saccharimonadales bacterium]|jgi:hypothetical protein